jgi:hypothetical protein
MRNSVGPANLSALEVQLTKSGSRIGAKEAVERIQTLRKLHVDMDLAVLEAYGWADIRLGHDFHSVEFLPENDRERYTISPPARREVLKRLLELNHRYHAEEPDRQKSEPMEGSEEACEGRTSRASVLIVRPGRRMRPK